MQKIKHLLQSILPRSVYRTLLVPYHLFWTWAAANKYGYPGKKLVVIGVTGTKGKSSVTEMISTILEEAGHTVASTSTIRFKIGNESTRNLYKMTLPGHGFLQKFLRDAVDAGCTHAVVELTSEGALQFRHLFTYMNALVFTNLEKEHIESHGSMQKYFEAKMRIGKALERSPKRPRAIIALESSEYGKQFLALKVEKQFPFSLDDADHLSLTPHGASFEYTGRRVTLSHPGAFSALNALAAIKVGEFFDVSIETAATALQKLETIPGRAERINEGQSFLAVVDYAHTPDSLRALYAAYPGSRKICVLGNTGGGRDTWKRPEMGEIADTECAEVILTNEDPYDENPDEIVAAMASGMKRTPSIIMDRREAIKTALSKATGGDVVLITGKGTDPYIMGANGTKEVWSDSTVVREELQKLKG